MKPNGLLPKKVVVVSVPFWDRSCTIASEEFRFSASVKAVKPKRIIFRSYAEGYNGSGV